MYSLEIKKKVYISTLPSPMKIYYPAGDRTTDPLNQRQTCYHLSQRGEQNGGVENVLPTADEQTYHCSQLHRKITSYQRIP